MINYRQIFRPFFCIFMVLSFFAIADSSELFNSNVEERRNFCKQIAIQAPNNLNGEIIQALTVAFSDPDSIVRRHASSAVWRYSCAKKYTGKENIDIAQYPDLEQILLDGINDQDEKVREFVISSFPGGLPGNKNLESLLIKRFEIEESSMVKSKILQSMILLGYDSNETKQLFKKALKDGNPLVAGWAACKMPDFNGLDVIPDLVAGLTSRDKFLRNRCSTAILSYGQEAEPFLVELQNSEQIRTPDIQNTIRLTLEEIRKD